MSIIKTEARQLHAYEGKIKTTFSSRCISHKYMTSLSNLKNRMTAALNKNLIHKIYKFTESSQKKLLNKKASDMDIELMRTEHSEPAKEKSNTQGHHALHIRHGLPARNNFSILWFNVYLWQHKELNKILNGVISHFVLYNSLPPAAKSRHVLHAQPDSLNPRVAIARARQKATDSGHQTSHLVERGRRARWALLVQDKYNPPRIGLEYQ